MNSENKLNKHNRPLVYAKSKQQKLNAMNKSEAAERRDFQKFVRI